MTSLQDVRMDLCITRMLGIVFFSVVFIFLPNPACAQSDVDPNIFRVYLPENDTAYDYLWLTTDDPSFKFRLKACDDAHIALARLPEKLTENTYEIIIGKSTVSIACSVGGEPKVESISSEKPLIECGLWHNMWVSWQDGVISVGNGNVGKNVIISYDDSESPYSVTVVAMASGPLSFGGTRWEFWRDEARTTIIRTSPENSKSDVWVAEYQQKHLTFAIRTCKTAKIYINDKMSNLGKAYSVTLGSNRNQKSKVTQKDNVLAQEDTPGILNCDGFRFFWLSWSSNVILVGRGLRVGDGDFLRTPFIDTTNLTSMTIQSSQTEAFWEFRNVEENYFLLRSQAGMNDSKAHAVNVEQRHTFLFRVRACAGAVIELKRKFGQHTSGTPRFVRMTIGAARNMTKLEYVWEDGRSDVTDTFTTPMVLDCNSFRHFWYSWKGEVFRLGTGQVPFMDELFHIRDRYVPLSVQSLHLSSANVNKKVEWQFDRDQGKSVTIQTTPAFSHNQAWFTVAESPDIVFKVKSCHSAKILLATYLASPEVHAYEVILGGNDNTVSTIAKDTRGNMTASVKTGAFLDCKASRFFWISWKGGSFEVGRGNVPGVTGFLKLLDGDPYQINAVSFAGDVSAEWHLTEAEGEQYIVYTDKFCDYFWLATHRYVFPFQLKTLQVVNIILTKIPGQVIDGDVELLLGLLDNTQSSIQILGDDSSTVLNNTYDILDEFEMKTYWLAWLKDKIQFGEGYPFNKVLLELQLPQSFRPRGITFDHKYPGPAEWAFNPELALSVMKQTPQQQQYYPYRYDQLWATTAGTTSHVFRVRAGADANLVLAPYIEDTESGVYEITIGADANNITLLRDGTHINKDKPGKVLERRITRNILSADEARTFWISWANGYIQLGRGYDVGVDRILGWESTEPREIHAISIATESTEGIWEFSNIPNKIYHMETAPTSGADKFANLLLTTSRTYIQFRSLTCTSARIALFSNLRGGRHPELHIYEIVIGENGTQTVSLYRPVGVFDQELLTTVPYPEVLQCGHAQLFWISWDGGFLQVGEGRMPSKVILTWEDQMFTVNAFSFGSGDEGLPIPGQWEIDHEAVDRLMFTTSGVKNYDQFWLTTSSRDFFMFRLITCGYASLALSELAGVIGSSTYEIVIGCGEKHNTVTILKSGVEKNSVNIPDLLNCDRDYHYWVGWRGGVVSLGRGSILGEVELIQWHDPTPHKVHYVAVTSDKNIPGSWGFDNLQGNMYEISTKPTDDTPESYSELWFAPLRHEQVFAFLVAACKNARLALAVDAGQFDHGTYEIVIGGREEDSDVEFTAIRGAVGRNTTTRVKTTSILDCADQKDFWVSWKGQEIRLGSGQPFGSEILKYKIPIFGSIPRIVSMATGPKADGNWAFNTEQVEGIHVHITEKKRYKQFWLSVSDKDRLVFSVKACHHATLVLAAVPFENFKEAYEIEIYTVDGTTMIRDGVNGEVHATIANRGPLLDCAAYRTLWVDWTSSHVSLGTGAYVGRQEVVRFNPPSGMHSVSSIGISMGGDYTGWWNFVRSEGNVYRLITKHDVDYGTSWLIVKRQYITFSVRACSDAHIALLGQVGNFRDDLVEIVIGAWENTKVELRFLQNPTPEETVERTGLLDCNRLRRFWISWRKDIIDVGTGRLDSHALLSWPFREPGVTVNQTAPFDILAVAFATRDVDGEWEIDQQYESCLGGLELVHKVSEGLASDCPLVHGQNIAGALLCRELTCTHNGNVMNYRPSDGLCYVKLCPSLDDLQLTDAFTGYEVHRLTKAVETYVAFTGPALDFEQHWVSVTGSDSIVFMVKVCSDAHLALAAIPGISQTMAYEVVIGGSGNRRSSIRADTGTLTNPLVIQDTPNILHCFNWKTLWISWLHQEIEVGEGAEVGMSPFLTWKSTDALQVINSVGVSTSSGSKGEWSFGYIDPNMPKPVYREDMYVVKTNKKAEYDNAIWTVSRDYVQFSVRACSDAHVIVSEVPGRYIANAFKLVIGLNGNTQTSIVAQGGSTEPWVQDTPKILDCNIFKAFWIKWNKQVIVLGEGTDLDKNKKISLYAPDMHPITGVSIATNGVTGIWKISKSIGHEYQFGTQGVVDYDDVWMDARQIDSLVFEVRACYDVKLLLNGEMEQGGDAYEVVLGANGNEASYIRNGKDGKSYVTQDTPRILDCYEYRSFWIRWVQGVEVGYGWTVGNRPFMAVYQTVSKLVEAIGLSTGDATKGSWRFDEFGDDHFYLAVPTGGLYRSAWLHTTAHVFSFQLQVCTDAVLYLGPNYLHADPNVPAYEIVLANGMSVIRRLPGPVTLYNTTTPDLVECLEFKRLWVSWSDGDIRVGTGQLFQYSVLFVHDPDPVSVRAISMATIDTGNGPSFWKFARHAGKSTVLITQANTVSFDKWLSIKEQTFVVFKLRAKADAHIALAEFFGVVTVGAYEVVLGGQDNHLSQIKDRVGGKQMNSAESQILNEDQGRWFWISWANDVIDVGLGPTVGYDAVMQWDASKFEGRHPVNAISILTLTVDGYWEFADYPNGIFEVITPKEESTFDYAWVTLNTGSFTFELKACPEAYVLLTEFPGDANGNRYQLVLGDVTHLSKIRDFDSLQELARKNTTGLLKCYEYVQFWVSWPNPMTDFGEVKFGTGSDVGENEIFSADDELLAVPIHAVTMGTSELNEGAWVFDSAAGATSTFTTSEEYNRDQLILSVADRKAVLLKIKAKENAHILLYEQYHASLAYEVIIGGDKNQITGIKLTLADKDFVASSWTPYILNATEFTQFWVSWANSRVAVGRGVIIDENEIVGHTDERDSKIAVQYLSLSTGWGVAGTWQYTPYFPDMLLVHSPPDAKSQTLTFSFASTEHSFTFFVRACEHAQVFLLPGKGQSPVYEVSIATQGNTVTKLVRSGIEVHDQLTPDALDCHDYRKFWISWEDGLIELAMGGEAGRRILDWKDPAPLAVHALSVATPEDFDADWKLFRSSGPNLEFRMVSSTSYRGLWYTLTGRHVLVFGVKTTKSVSILLTQVPGLSTIDGYEVHLSNDLSLIINHKTGKTMTLNATPFLLSQIEFRSFWCTWDKDMLQVGSGAVPGGSPFLHAYIDPGYEVNAATFGVKDEATWSFSQDLGNNYIITTIEDLKYDVAWFAPKTDTFAFSVQASQDAQVALSKVPEVTTTDTYELWFGSNDNTQLDIFYNGVFAMSVPGKGRLDRTKMKDFWVQWSKRTLIVGEGPAPDGVIAEYESDSTVDVAAVALSVDAVSLATWKVGLDQEIMARLTTTSNGTFGQHWVTVAGFTSAVFRVRSCGPARVALAAIPGNILVFSTEIVLGDGDRSYILDGVTGRERDSADTPGLLHCDEFRAFWISWSKSHLAFGRGATVSQRTFLHYRDQDVHDVLSMTLATGPTTEGARNGTWEFFRMRGNVLYETSPPDARYTGAIIRPPDKDNFQLTFHVRTCADAHIMLVPLIAPDITNYEVIFGSSANTLSEIRKSGKMVDRVPTPYMMTANMDLPLWIDWRSGNITAGLGPLYTLRKKGSH